MTNNTTTQTTTGYVCKSCGNPSPIGVGYTDNTPGAREASLAITRCQCGHSVAASVLTVADGTASIAARLQAANVGSVVGIRGADGKSWACTWTLNEDGDWTIAVPTAPAMGFPRESRTLIEWANALHVGVICGDDVVLDLN
jgi:hypothetical protein